jgi:hypothetical protein
MLPWWRLARASELFVESRLVVKVGQVIVGGLVLQSLLQGPPLGDLASQLVVGRRKICGALAHPALQLLLGALALGYVHQNVHSTEQFAGLVVDGVGVGKCRKVPAVRSLYDDLPLVVPFVRLEGQCHPASIVGERRSD